MREELFHLLLFLAISLLAFQRANLPDFYEKHVYVKGTVVGDVQVEEGYTLTKIRVEESEIEEIEGRKALLKVFGYPPFRSNRLELLGNVSVRNNRVYIWASSREVRFLPEEKGVRDFLIERYIRTSKDKEATALGLSFLFGEPREFLPSEVQRSFLSTGLVHLLVVSGLHVGTVALTLSYMLPKLWGLRFSLVGVILYVLFVVPHEPPVLRAGIMISLVILSILSFRQPNTLSILLFSGSVILLLYPHYLFSYSFWLSFMATAYIILTLHDLEGSWGFKTLLASLSAFTGVSPLVGTFSYLSPLSVLLTPILAPIVLIYALLGVLSLFTAMSFPPFVDLFNLWGRLFEGVVSFSSHLSLHLYPSVSSGEAWLLSISGLVLIYFTKGAWKLLPLLFINGWLLLRTLA